MLDNCDFNREHLTVEVIEKECIDTSMLSTMAKSKEEALTLFNKEVVLLGSEQNRSELEHFKYVVGVAVGRVLASRRSNAKLLTKHLPPHHSHQGSKLNKLSQKLGVHLSFSIKLFSGIL